ncbi:MAG: DUF3368 domain-containing protein [Nitrospirae bacterium]|nr:DUF3368 domain-containing protein [Nitrospirota bacterium]
MGEKITTTLIVSDSGPLISFARAKKLYLVREVYGAVIIPPAVYNEIVVKGKDKPGAEEIKRSNWITIQEPKNKDEVKRLNLKFDPGESEAVALAQELTATLLVDERIVIKEARSRGLKITSTHMTLERAKTKRLIKSVKIELDALIAAGFRTTKELVTELLQKMGE